MVGHYLCKKLVGSGAQVDVIDKVSGEVPGVNYHQIDIVEYPGVVERCVSELMPDCAINLAAKVTGITFNENHHYTMASENALLSMIPLKACARMDCRYVFTSTACVYPPNAPIPTIEESAEQLEPESTNQGYGWAKLYSEWLHEWARQENPNFRPLVLRPSNMYSPREHFADPDAHVIPRLAYRLLSGETPMVVRGTGKARRSFLHARDAADGIVAAAETDYCGTLNLAASEDTEISIEDLLGVLCRLTDRYPDVQWDSSADDGYPRRLSSTERFNSVCDWRPRIALEDGLREVVEGCIAHMRSMGTIDTVQGR